MAEKNRDWKEYLGVLLIGGTVSFAGYEVSVEKKEPEVCPDTSVLEEELKDRDAAILQLAQALSLTACPTE